MQIGNNSKLSFLLALKLIPGIGEQTGRKLLPYRYSHPGLFSYSPSELEQVFPLSDKKLIQQILNRPADLTDMTNRQIELLIKNDIYVVCLDDPDYPLTLKEIPDAPLMLFCKGNLPAENDKNIAIVGTRNCSEWALNTTAHIIRNLAAYRAVIISGLASGIDTAAHQAAIQNKLPTIGVMAHGHLKIYPYQNTSLAQSIINCGGALITEHLPNVSASVHNFPLRNRIVAGLSKMTVIIESPVKGGAMITGKLAAAYNREVGAVCGRPSDTKSLGCHYLIKRQIAHLIEHGDDVAHVLNWDIDTMQAQPAQLKLYNDLNLQESEVVRLLQNRHADALHIDDILLRTGKSNTDISQALLHLELNGYVRSLSGKRYQLV